MPEAVEVPMEADLSKHGLPTLIGVLDLVRAGGRIVDFKTSGKTPSPEDATHQNEIQLPATRFCTGKHGQGRQAGNCITWSRPRRRSSSSRNWGR